MKGVTRVCIGTTAVMRVAGELSNVLILYTINTILFLIF